MVERVAQQIRKDFLRGIITRDEYDTYMDRLANVVLYGLDLPEDFVAAINSIVGGV